MKRYVISVDCEGVACVVGFPGMGLTKDNPAYPFAAREAMLEANAAAKALFDSGADEVIIWDSHGTGVNFDYDLVDPRCKIALGSGFGGRIPGMDESFSGLLFIGYHAKEGTKDGVLAHSYSSVTYQYVKVNGKEVGEMEVDAAIAGRMGVKVLFTATDAEGVKQAKESFPWIETVTTKEGSGWHAAVSLHPKEAQRQIYEAVKRAVQREDEMQVYTFEEPLNVSIRYKRLDTAHNVQLFDRERKPFAFADGFTREGTLNDVTELYL